MSLCVLFIDLIHKSETMLIIVVAVCPGEVQAGWEAAGGSVSLLQTARDSGDQTRQRGDSAAERGPSLVPHESLQAAAGMKEGNKLNMESLPVGQHSQIQQQTLVSFSSAALVL